jgi:formylglycine-generating enzyme required for sulfatase activity
MEKSRSDALLLAAAFALAWLFSPTLAYSAGTSADHPSMAVIKEVQTRLNSHGFDAGKPDGRTGRRTRQAIIHFQRAKGLKANGKITPDLVRMLRGVAPQREPEVPAEERTPAAAEEVRKRPPEAEQKALSWEREFVTVPGGCYQMGSNQGHGDEIPVHKVCVSSFSLGRHEVTQGMWEAVMGNNPSMFRKGPNYPVESVSWQDVQGFINKLNRLGRGRFRLPTEAEWEYACRSGGKDETYSGGESLDRVAWYANNAGGATHPVGTKSPNGLGLYDMSGNLLEWAQDIYDFSAYEHHARNNPVNTAGGSNRVFRSGAWSTVATSARCAGRDSDVPDFRSSVLGFRLLRK